MSSSNPVGRPLKFKSIKDLDEKIDAYFKEMDEKERPYTITGLAVALDTNRETLIDYQNSDDPRKQIFSDAIKRAKIKIHNYTEESLWRNGIQTGMIFNLKNNWGWKDRSEIDNTTDLNIQWVEERTEEDG